MTDVVGKAMKLSGCNDQELMQILVDWAEELILTETNRTVMIDQLHSSQLELALYLYNRTGTEGEVSRSEGGISITYADMPKNVQDRISQYRLARSGGRAFEKKPIEESSTEETTSD